MQPLSLTTSRLRLLAATAETARMAVWARPQLSAELKARIPGAWPPEIQREAMDDYARLLAGNAELAGWLHWFFVSVEEEPRVLIGGGGFKGPPQHGQVELGYAVLDPYQRRGYASEAVGALLEWAFADSRVQRVTAEVETQNAASVRVLTKNGFRFVGQADQDGVLLFARVSDRSQIANTRA